MTESLSTLQPIPKPRLRRIILPVVLVVGTLYCGIAALFVGVKEDLPAPPNAARYPLSLSGQNAMLAQFPGDTQNFKSPDVAVYVLRDTPEEAANYWRDAFVSRRNWKEISPPAQPKDHADIQFNMLGFNRAGSKVILAITQADKLLALDNDLTRAIKAANYRPGDTVAIMLAGDIK
ncbi:MAG TPA: hypothetical protein VH186_00490 [Chloroflexia bacterium]|nr:hypothetical protein [Chloroflexia bacterium]